MIKPAAAKEQSQTSWTIRQRHWDFLQLALNNSQQNDNNEEEESDVKHDTIDLVVVAIRFADFIADTTTGSYTFVQVEYEALKRIKYK